MAKHIAQFRLPGIELSFVDGWSKQSILQGRSATSLSIYGMPGTEFQIAQNGTLSSFKLNNTGLFSISFDNYPITGLYLSETSYQNITAENSGHALIIDYIYIDEEVEK